MCDVQFRISDKLACFGQLIIYGSWPLYKKCFFKMQHSIRIGSYIRTDPDRI